MEKRYFFTLKVYNIYVNLVRLVEDMSVEYPLKQETTRFFYSSNSSLSFSSFQSGSSNVSPSFFFDKNE